MALGPSPTRRGVSGRLLHRIQDGGHWRIEHGAHRLFDGADRAGRHRNFVHVAHKRGHRPFRQVILAGE